MNPPLNVSRPASIRDFSDGSCYDCSGLLRREGDSYLSITELDGVYIKAATRSLMSDLVDYLPKLEQLDEQELADYDRIRLLEDIERPSCFNSALEQYVEFRNLLPAPESSEPPRVDVSTMPVMFLVLCRFNYNRLRSLSTAIIPESRFVFVRTEARGFLPWKAPNVMLSAAVVQQKAAGTKLSDMYDQSSGAIQPEWRASVGCISGQLLPMLDPAIARYIDWSPDNFIYSSQEERLYYVDSEPNIWMGKRVNEHNLYGIRRFFCS